MRAIILLLLLATPLPAREAVSIIINNDDLRDEVAQVEAEFTRACGIEFVHAGQQKPYIVVGWEAIGNAAVIAQTNLDIPNNGRSFVALNPLWAGWNGLDETNRYRVRQGAIRHEFMHALFAMEHSPDKSDVSNGLGSIPKWFSPREVQFMIGWYGRGPRPVVPNWLDSLIEERKYYYSLRTRIEDNVSITLFDLSLQEDNHQRVMEDIELRKVKIREAKSAGQTALEANLRRSQANAVERRDRIRAEIIRLRRQLTAREDRLADVEDEITRLSKIINPELDKYN